MKIFMITVLLIFIILFNYTSAQELEITLTMDKSNYLKYETIESIAELKNVSTKEVFISRTFEAAVPTSGTEILLFDENGKRVLAKGYQFRAHGYFIGFDLFPNQTLVSFLNFSQLGLGEIALKDELVMPGMVAFEYTFLPVGRYKIQLSYTYLSGKVERKIFSNICEFSISEPTEDDLIIFNEIREINGKMFSIPETKYPESVKTIFNKYPNHVYTLAVYENFITTVYQKESDQQEYLLKMIEDHPSSFLTLRSVIGCRKLTNEFRDDTYARFKAKSELNKTILEKYENYQKIITRK